VFLGGECFFLGSDCSLIGDQGSGTREQGDAFKGRVFKISKIVEKILKCFTWFGCFRIFKSAEMVKKLPNTKSLPLKGRETRGWGDAGMGRRGDAGMGRRGDGETRGRGE
jgi:hypothetical protein